jgi:hypothetical protein
MLSTIQIWSPGETFMFLCILMGVCWFYWNKFNKSNPEAGARVKKMAAAKAIGLIAKWLK